MHLANLENKVTFVKMNLLHHCYTKTQPGIQTPQHLQLSYSSSPKPCPKPTNSEGICMNYQNSNLFVPHNLFWAQQIKICTKNNGDQYGYFFSPLMCVNSRPPIKQNYPNQSNAFFGPWIRQSLAPVASPKLIQFCAPKDHMKATLT